MTTPRKPNEYHPDDGFEGDPLDLTPDSRRLKARLDLRRALRTHLFWILNGANMTNTERMAIIHDLTNPKLIEAPKEAMLYLREQGDTMARCYTNGSAHVAAYYRASDLFEDAALAIAKANADEQAAKAKTETASV